MPNVLIVEDEMLVACHMQDVLEEQGYSVVGIAPDVASSHAHVDKAIDLALVDLNLRDGFTGPQIATMLSEAGVPVIFVTANPAQVTHYPARVVGVLTKPTDEHVLLGSVDFALRYLGGEAVAPPPGLTRIV